MKTKNTHRNVARVTETSGNVFADLGLPNPEQELLKAQLTLHISTILRDSGLTQVQIARVLSVQGSARCYSWTRSTAFFSTAGKLLQQASLWTLRTLMPSPFTKSMGFSNYRMSKDGYSFPWERLRNCFDSPPAERKRVPWGVDSSLAVPPLDQHQGLEEWLALRNLDSWQWFQLQPGHHGSAGSRCIDCAQSGSATEQGGGCRRTGPAFDKSRRTHSEQHPRHPSPIRSCASSTGAGVTGVE